MNKLHTWVLAVAISAAAGFAATRSGDAVAAASPAPGAAASLGAGGTVTGDISRDAGDADVVTLDLLAGSTLDVKFTSAFAADVVFTAPSGVPADLAWGTAPSRTRKAFPVTESGRWSFRIASADGSQGRYTLTAAVKWAKKRTIPGRVGDPLVWSLPAGATVKGKIAAVPARSWTPAIDAVTGPDGASLLRAPVAGRNGAVAVPAIRAAVTGDHEVGVSGGEAGSAYQVLLALKAPKSVPVRADISNGLTPVSFSGDGVAALLQQKCSACHAWTGTAAAFRPQAAQAAARMKSGNMPQGGPRSPAADIELIRAWIATGYAE